MADQPHPLAGQELGEAQVLAALKHGVLVREGIKLRVGGELRHYQPGEVVPVSGADATPAAELVSTVASLLALRASSPLQVFVDRKSLDLARDRLHADLAKREDRALRRSVQAELDRFQARNGVISEPSLGRLLDRVLGESPEGVAAKVRADTLSDYGFGGGGKGKGK